MRRAFEASTRDPCVFADVTVVTVAQELVEPVSRTTLSDAVEHARADHRGH